MKKLIWKLRFAWYFMRKCEVTWKLAWDTAEGFEEVFGHDESPIDGAEEEIDAWWNSQ